MDVKESLSKIIKELNVELNRILQYWKYNTVDDEFGGFVGQIDHFNHVIPKASKGAVLNTRIMWTFSAAFNFTHNNTYLEIATRAYNYVKKYFLDNEHGGLIWEVDHTGIPLNTRKQTYAQGFGIYGFSEYYRASGDKECLNMAIDLFRNIEKYCFDPVHGGYTEALNQSWQPMEDMRLSAKDENYPKSMNTHLHILEPYTNLYRVWPDKKLAEQMRRLIRTFIDFIIDSKTGHFNLFFENDWTIKSEILSYGHDIEGAWLLTEAAEVLGDEELLKEVEQVAIKMADVTAKEGLAKDGSLYYERESADGLLDTDRHWWVQAEAVVGFLNAYQISGEGKYFSKAINAWNFIREQVIDKANGEWFGRMAISGEPITDEDKAGFWKCPYHNGRACIEAIQRIEQIEHKQ